MEFEKIKPKYLYSFVDSIIVDLKKNLYFLIKDPGLLKTIIFVFLNLPVVSLFRSKRQVDSDIFGGRKVM